VTERLYLDDAYQREFDADVVARDGAWCRLSRTLFYPGGGGQPADRGQLRWDGGAAEVATVREDDAGCVWHQVGDGALPAAIHGVLDWPYRYTLMRYHGLMHVVNAIARAHFGGVITGVQIGAEQSRIDFRLPDFAREKLPDFEALVNAVITRDLPVAPSTITEEEFRARPELVRTLNVAPPVVDGQVRIVSIQDFDEQACGATHVHATGEIGSAQILRFDNKGKDNKRLYWKLA
jgi:misacylated tRNA(Ala) deacylase